MQERGQKASRGGAPLPTLLSLERTIAARRDSAGPAKWRRTRDCHRCCVISFNAQDVGTAVCSAGYDLSVATTREPSQALWTGRSRGRSSTGTPGSSSKRLLTAWVSLRRCRRGVLLDGQAAGRPGAAVREGPGGGRRAVRDAGEERGEYQAPKTNTYFSTRGLARTFMNLHFSQWLGMAIPRMLDGAKMHFVSCVAGRVGTVQIPQMVVHRSRCWRLNTYD